MKRGILLAAIAVLMVVLGGIVPAVGAPKSIKRTEVSVASISELLPYLKRSSVDVVMAPGVYRVSAADVESGVYTSGVEVIEGRGMCYSFLLFEGDDSTYDFSGVTLEVECAAVNSFEGSYYAVYELHAIGNGNVIKGLKLVDVGGVNDYPTKSRWLNIVLDGTNNRFEGVEVNSCGSSPYGYGEVFGKGTKNVIKHNKHSCVLVRGTDNHVKDCKIYHRAYGHFLAIQGAVNPTIEGCYIEGEMTTTDKILAEAGTGSAADKIDFMTVFGYKLPSGYTLCLGEDGIRTYAEGDTYINGERVKQKTGGMVMVKNCTVKHARGGVALALGDGQRYVENCTLIGCQGGFAVNNGGRIVNCRADVEFGPAFKVAYEHNKGIKADITIMPYEGEKYVGNGSGHVAFIKGMTHDLTFKMGEGLELTPNLAIYVGGDNRTIGQLAEVDNISASNNVITNETGYPIIIGNDTSYNTIITGGDVDGNTSDNTIEEL